MTKTGRPITLMTWANGAHTAYALFLDTSTGKDNLGHLTNALGAMMKGDGTTASQEMGLVGQGMKDLATENGAKVAAGWIGQLALRWLAKKAKVSTVVANYKNRPIRLV